MNKIRLNGRAIEDISEIKDGWYMICREMTNNVCYIMNKQILFIGTYTFDHIEGEMCNAEPCITDLYDTFNVNDCQLCIIDFKENNTNLHKN